MDTPQTWSATNGFGLANGRKTRMDGHHGLWAWSTEGALAPFFHFWLLGIAALSFYD
jgi:hypothetical protein